MAIRIVTVKIRIKTPEGKRVYANPVWEKKGSLKPLYARVAGKAEHHPEGVYALRYGNKWDFVGQQTDVVMATKLRREQELEDAASAPAAATPTLLNLSGPKILDALELHLAQMETTNLETGKEAAAQKSIDEMCRTVEAFQRTCKKTYVREVTGVDLVGYFAMMRVQANLNPKASTEKVFRALDKAYIPLYKSKTMPKDGLRWEDMFWVDVVTEPYYKNLVSRVRKQVAREADLRKWQKAMAKVDKDWGPERLDFS